MLNNHLDPYGFMIPEILGAGGFSDEYQIVYDAFTTKPSDDVAAEQNAMVIGLIEDGIWDKLDVFYITASQSLVDSLINWINPGTHDLTIVNLIAGLWTQYRGWTGNGVNGYLNTNYNPNTDAINYALNSGSMGCYVRTDVNENKYDMGAESGVGFSIIATRFTNAFYGRLNCDDWNSVANTDSRGFFIVSRLEAASFQIYKNKTETSLVETSTSIPNGNIYILGGNAGGLNIPCTKQISAAFAGGGMTQTNVDNFTDRLELFLDSIGAGVIS